MPLIGPSPNLEQIDSLQRGIDDEPRGIASPPAMIDMGQPSGIAPRLTAEAVAIREDGQQESTCQVILRQSDVSSPLRRFAVGTFDDRLHIVIAEPGQCAQLFDHPLRHRAAFALMARPALPAAVQP
jgi:hypothetical protein